MERFKGSSGKNDSLVSTVVNLPSSLFDLFDFLLCQVGQFLGLSQLFDPSFVTRSSDCYDVLCSSPEEESSRGIDVLSSLFRETLSNAFEDRLDGSSSLVTKERGERTVRFSQDTVLFLNLEYGFEVFEDVRVVLDLVHDGLVLDIGFEEFLEILRAEVGNSEGSGEFALVLHVFEDLPELDEFALGRNERVVDQDD